MVDVYYVDYGIFGQPPSKNFNWNVIVGDSNIPASPYFSLGLYKQYYCLLSDLSIYKSTPTFE